VRTNIRATGKRKFRQFSWIEGYTDITDEDTGQSRGMSLTISDWLYEGILMDGGVLAVSPEYFTITGGRERWLYRIARKHAGGHGWPGFAISLPTLFEKSGAEGTYRRFKHELKRIAEANDVPEFAFLWEERGGKRSRPCAWSGARTFFRRTRHTRSRFPGPTTARCVPDRPRIDPTDLLQKLIRGPSRPSSLAYREHLALSSGKPRPILACHGGLWIPCFLLWKPLAYQERKRLAYQEQFVGLSGTDGLHKLLTSK
jgi:hypothetical protein